MISLNLPAQGLKFEAVARFFDSEKATIEINWRLSSTTKVFFSQTEFADRINISAI